MKHIPFLLPGDKLFLTYAATVAYLYKHAVFRSYWGWQLTVLDNSIEHNFVMYTFKVIFHWGGLGDWVNKITTFHIYCMIVVQLLPVIQNDWCYVSLILWWIILGLFDNCNWAVFSNKLYLNCNLKDPSPSCVSEFIVEQSL